MNNRNRSTYQEDIRSEYQKKGRLLLPETTSLKIKKRCLFLLDENLEDSDKKIVVNFLKLDRKTENLFELVKEIDVDKFKPISTFFSSNQNLRYEEAQDFAAFITGFSPRPYLNYLKEGVAQENEIEDEILIDKMNPSKNRKLPFKPLIFIGIIMMLLMSVWILKDLFKIEEAVIPQKIEITNHNYHGDLNYYYNIDDTGKIELYDKKGVISESPLIPVTKEIMLTYFEQNNDKDIRKWTKETILDKDEKIEESLTEKELKKEIKNTALIKPKAIKSTKVVITNNNILDAFTSMTFKQKYTKTKEKYTCIGTVEYTYKDSSVSNKLTVCNAVLIYKIISNITGEEIDAGIINSIGTDSSESRAKQNAISRLIIK